MAKHSTSSQELTIGVRAGLRFALSWDSPTLQSRATAAEATLGSLYVEVNDTPVWGTSPNNGLHWHWVDLLEHLTEHWSALVVEESDPLNLGGPISALREAAERQWNGADRSQRISLQRRFLRFETAHNLATALGGADISSLWMLREGASILIGQAGEHRLPFAEVRATIAKLGDDIAVRLGALSDGRARSARHAWKRRDEVTIEQKVSLSTSLTSEKLQELRGRNSSRDFWGVDDTLSLEPQLVAARMLGTATDVAVTRKVVEWIRERAAEPARGHSVRLAEWSSLAEQYLARLELGESEPHNIGYALAEWLRSIPGVVSQAGRADPGALLAATDVHVDFVKLGSKRIEAIACWGAKHSPAIMLNVDGRYNRGKAGQRATLAHEICHLLVDRQRALPVAEVLGGFVPKDVEQRANAFAAELLVPRVAAGEAFASHGDPIDVVSELTSRYGASKEIVAWQAFRSKVRLGKSVLDYLRTLVSKPNRFIQRDS
jgi:hypothetical protein